MEEWIAKAINGNVDYFREVQKGNPTKTFVDKYGMTPLMYAVLGSGFNKILDIPIGGVWGKRGARNCLGHTAWELYLCVAGEKISNKVYQHLHHSAVAKGTKEIAGGVLRVGSALIGEAVFSTIMGEGFSGERVGQKLSNSGTFDADSLEYVYPDFRKLEFERLAQIPMRIKESAVQRAVLTARLSMESTMMEEAYARYHKEQMEYYHDRIGQMWQETMKNEARDEFETQDEYEARIRPIFQSRIQGLSNIIEGKVPIPSEDQEAIRENAEQFVQSELQKIREQLNQVENESQSLSLRSELLEIYVAIPFYAVTLESYDAEGGYFPLSFMRYQHASKVSIPRELARIVRAQPNSYTYDVSVQRLETPLQYRVIPLFDISGQRFEGDPVCVKLLPEKVQYCY